MPPYSRSLWRLILSQFSYVRLLGMVAEKEAKRKRSKALADLIKNGPRAFDPRRITFGEWLERWIDSLPALWQRIPGASTSTGRGPTSSPLWGRSSSRSSPLSTSTVYTEISRVGRAPLREGSRAFDGGPDPLDGEGGLGPGGQEAPDPPQRSARRRRAKVEKKERTTLDLDGLGCFFAAAAGERLEGLWIVWCLTGLRPGEILGLKWADVRLPEDGSDGELLIRPSWSATRTGAVMRETTKTGKGRPVSLLSEATAAMSAHRMRYLEELVRYRDLVFPSRAGTPRPRQREPPAVQEAPQEGRPPPDAPLRHPALLRNALD